MEERASRSDPFNQQNPSNPFQLCLFDLCFPKIPDEFNSAVDGPRPRLSDESAALTGGIHALRCRIIYDTRFLCDLSPGLRARRSSETGRAARFAFGSLLR